MGWFGSFILGGVNVYFAMVDSVTNVIKSVFGGEHQSSESNIPIEEGCYLVPLQDDVYNQIIDRMFKCKGLKIKDKTSKEYINLIEELGERNLQLENEIMELKNYLSNTDFYFVRQLDSGKPVPQEVKLKRNQIRIRLSELGL